MTNYIIFDDSKEFKTNAFLVMALCDDKNRIHITLNEELSNQIENKSNLYECIAEAFESGKYFILEEFKCFLIGIKEAKQKGLIR